MDNVTEEYNVTLTDISDTVIFLNSLRTCFGLVSMGGNFFIILCTIQYRSLQTPTNIIIANLAGADFVNGFNMVFASVMNLTLCTGFRSASKTLWVIQKSNGFVGYLTNNIAIFYIGLERFLNIKLALRYQSVVTNSRVTGFLALTWIGCIITSIVSTSVSFEVMVKAVMPSLCGVLAIGTIFLYGYVCCSAYKFIKINSTSRNRGWQNC